MPKTSPADSHLPPFVHNQSLFSSHFLAERLPAPTWGAEAIDAFAKLQALYESTRDVAKSWNEAQTESEFVRPAL